MGVDVRKAEHNISDGGVGELDARQYRRGCRIEQAAIVGWNAEAVIAIAWNTPSRSDQ
ncbi:MAG: hypothetical protein JO227_09690 [Acetobacteraceae bacterium]|nr:hypothetical protein [Acetobacteraceae bacterium]